MSTDDSIRLGQDFAYQDQYNPALLEGIPRSQSRQNLPQLSFFGSDLWTAYELSWLAPGGKPVVAIAEFSFPADSDFIVESKSFKYYLNSFNQSEFASEQSVQAQLEADLSAKVGKAVGVKLFRVDDFPALRPYAPQGQCVDQLDLAIGDYQPNAQLLEFGAEQEQAVYYSHLLKSNCPVTGQPDWASVWVGYKGRALKPASLLAYVVSFRQHQDFHENCVEQMYSDLWSSGEFDSLWVYARYTRRGGLDINPFRSSEPMALPDFKAARQ